MFTNKTTISSPDESGAFPNGEVFTDTSIDGCIFAQSFGGSSSISKNATTANVVIHYNAPSEGLTGVAMSNILLTITDASVNVNYQIYMQYDSSLVGSPWKLEINGKEYGSIEASNPSHLFTEGSSHITI